MIINKSSSKKDIKNLQLNLELLGFNVGKSGADGYYGSNTQGAVYDFIEAYNLDTTLKLDNGIPEDIVAEINKQAELKRKPAIITPLNFLDLTASAWPGPRKKIRDWKNVKGITLHQTGCFLGERPQRWSNWTTKNKEGVIVSSSLKAHMGITQKGQILLIHPLESFVWHAQGLSHETVGFEIDGCFEGIKGDLSTYPGKKGGRVAHLTPEQEKAVKDAVLYVKQVLQANGSDLEYMVPHRCSSDTRRPDCGEEIYKAIALWAEKELNVDLKGPNFKKGSGYTIPEIWNPAYVGNKY